MNLNPAGVGDVDPRALEKLDLVLGSFHSVLRRTEDQTERYVAAISNPHVHVLAEALLEWTAGMRERAALSLS